MLFERASRLPILFREIIRCYASRYLIIAILDSGDHCSRLLLRQLAEKIVERDWERIISDSFSDLFLMKDFRLSDLVQSSQQSPDVSIIIAYQSMIFPATEEYDRRYLHEIVTMNHRPDRKRIIAFAATRSSHQLELVLKIGFRYDLGIPDLRDQR